MKKMFVALVAEIAYRLGLFVANHVSDAWIHRQVDRAKRLAARRDPRNHLITVLGDLNKIFADPKSSALARRMIREARPAQFKAVVRGALS
jgi:hypothetical protein